MLDTLTTTAIEIPLAPPGDWLRTVPEWWDPTGPLIQTNPTEPGRVAALVAPYDECILDGREGCLRPGMSPSGYDYAHVGVVDTAEGETVRVANIGGNINHPNIYASVGEAQKAYEHTATRRMYGRYIDAPDHGGILFLGSLYPGTTPQQLHEIRLSALSGDWRWIESFDSYDMSGSQLVNNPGFRPNHWKNGGAHHRPKFATRNIGTMVASAPDCDECPSHATRLRGEWVAPELTPLERLVDRIATIEMGVAAVVAGLVDDRGSDMDDHLDYDDELSEIQGDECRNCNGDGCERCDWYGYTEPDDEAVAEVAAITAAARPRDGDGDGFVNDGKPNMRPFNPATDLGPRDKAQRPKADGADTPMAAPTKKGKVSVKPSVYKNKQGWIVTGKDADGGSVKVFFSTEGVARREAARWNAGETKFKIDWAPATKDQGSAAGEVRAEALERLADDKWKVVDTGDPDLSQLGVDDEWEMTAPDGKVYVVTSSSGVTDSTDEGGRVSWATVSVDNAGDGSGGQTVELESAEATGLVEAREIARQWMADKIEQLAETGTVWGDDAKYPTNSAGQVFDSGTVKYEKYTPGAPTAPDPTPAAVGPDGVRDAAQAAGGEPVRARVADNRMSSVGIAKGDVIEVRYKDDTTALVQATAKNGKQKTYQVQWARFDEVAGAPEPDPEPPTDGSGGPAPDVDWKLLGSRTRVGFVDGPEGEVAAETRRSEDGDSWSVELAWRDNDEIIDRYELSRNGGESDEDFERRALGHVGRDAHSHANGQGSIDRPEPESTPDPEPDAPEPEAPQESAADILGRAAGDAMFPEESEAVTKGLIERNDLIEQLDEFADEWHDIATTAILDGLPDMHAYFDGRADPTEGPGNLEALGRLLAHQDALRASAGDAYGSNKGTAILGNFFDLDDFTPEQALAIREGYEKSDFTSFRHMAKMWLKQRKAEDDGGVAPEIQAMIDSASEMIAGLPPDDGTAASSRERLGIAANWVLAGDFHGDLGMGQAEAVLLEAARSQEMGKDAFRFSADARVLAEYERWRASSDDTGATASSFTPLTDSGKFHSGDYMRAGLFSSDKGRYGLRFGDEAKADTKHASTVMAAAKADSPILDAQMEAWGHPGMAFFRKGTKATAWARMGSNVIGWSKGRATSRSKEFNAAADQVLENIGVDVRVTPTSARGLRQAAVDAGVNPDFHAIKYVSWVGDFRAEGILRHEYGHIVDGRISKGQIRHRERQAFDHWVNENYAEIHADMSKYAAANRKELFAEMFSLVTHPNFAKRRGYSPATERAFELFMDLIAPTTAVGASAPPVDLADAAVAAPGVL